MKKSGSVENGPENQPPPPPPLPGSSFNSPVVSSVSKPEEEGPSMTSDDTTKKEEPSEATTDDVKEDEEPSDATTDDVKEDDEPSDATTDDGKEDEEEEPPEAQVYFTIDDVVNKAGYGRFQKFITFLAGLGWLADAFEVIILSIIGDMLSCHWPMQRWQNAVLTSSVFIGMTIGAPIFGSFADRYGRRTALALAMLLLFIFGASSAASPNYTWMVVLRAFMGFSLGGFPQGVTLCCEYYPANMRGRAGFYLSYYWALGTIGVICLAWLVMSFTQNWRIFVLLAAMPALIVLLSMKWYPESARYFLVSNKPEKALKMLERLMRFNKKEMPAGQLLEMDASEEKGKLLDLLKAPMRRTTLLFWYIWLAVSMCYYATALITPIIVKEGSLLRVMHNRSNSSFASYFTSPMPCVVYTNANYRDLLWTSAAEFPGILAFTFIVECCARKIFLGATCFLAAFLMLFLMLEIKPDIAMFVLLFVLRALIAGVFQLLFIMTTESFPTTLRASAMGTGSGFARFGGLLVPYLAQVTVIARPMESIAVLSGIAVLAGFASFLLPLETRGRHMHQCKAKITFWKIITLPFKGVVS